MKEGMSILRGRKSIPGMNSSKREMEKSRISFHVLIRQMVNTRTDADLSAAVQNALQTLLPQIHTKIREEFRTSSGPSDAGGNPPPVTIHTWLERFNKQKPHSFEKATAPVDAENWISHMEKIFDVMGCEDAFKTRLAHIPSTYQLISIPADETQRVLLLPADVLYSAGLQYL
nr:zinc finger, CCHC-type, retrotransposon Gag domain protein [Tanacetum cinerariifolium]